MSNRSGTKPWQVHNDFHNVYRGPIDLVEEDKRPRHIDLKQRYLHRVFNNNSFSEGGRFYGGWWQTIPSALRPHITINWIPVRELDYSNMQISMLYARGSLQLGGDAYEIEGIDKSYRPIIKKAMLALVNAGENQKIQSPGKKRLPEGWAWRDILTALEEKHVAISKYFRSGIGLKMQRIDSDIAERVMIKMMEQNKLALPIHDSFIVQFCDHDVLLETMKQTYSEFMGESIRVDEDYPFKSLPLNQLSNFDYEEESLEDAVYICEHQDGFDKYRERKQFWLSKTNEEWRRKNYPH